MTKVAPADLMLGRGRTSGLPRSELSENDMRKMHATARENDKRVKAAMSTEYNKRMRATEPFLQVGSRVLLRQEIKRKSDTAWEVLPYVIEANNGSMLTASRQGHTCTRNSSCFKLLVDEDDDDESERSPVGDTPTAVPGEQTTTVVTSAHEEREEAEHGESIQPGAEPIRPTGPTHSLVQAAGEQFETMQPHAQPAPTPQPAAIARKVGGPTKEVSAQLAAERER